MTHTKAVEDAVLQRLSVEPRANEAAGIADAVRRLVADQALEFPFPGHGETAVRFQLLRALGQRDLCLARLAEGHVDALAILDEAQVAAPDGVLGVWAAGPLETLRARRTEGGWLLEGLRRWCSGAPDLDYALVSAAATDGNRLFLVPLCSTGIHSLPGTWPTIGMARTSTLDVEFNQVELVEDAAVGDPGFYLDRDGFWFGGAGVAAVWLGGAVAVGSTLAAKAGTDPHRLAHLGWVTARVAALEAFLAAVAEAIDRDGNDKRLIEKLAQCLRAEVADAAAEIIDRTGRATGASPLSHDKEHAQRVADLSVYIRQSHAEADLENLGRLELEHRALHADD
jgi:alkylation response protein AidB-like acyl-CoA dehydrogenase